MQSRIRSLFEHDAVLPDGSKRGLCAVADVHLAEDAREVIFDGLFTDVEMLSDSLVGHAARDAFEDFELAYAEGLFGRCLLCVVCPLDLTDDAFAVCDAGERVDKLGRVCVSGEISVGTESKGGAAFDSFGVADHKDAGRAFQEVELMEDLTAVKERQVVAEKKEVGLETMRFFDGLFAVCGFAYDVEPVTFFERASDADAKERCPFGYDDGSFGFSHRSVLVS